jgi:sulfotransferase family protein
MALFGRKTQAAEERAPFPFVVGMNRSGTTLLRMMLDAHPELTIPPETHFVPDLIRAVRKDGAPEAALAAMKAHREWEDFNFSDDEALAWLRESAGDPGESVRAFYRTYAARQGKPRWGEKTPRYVSRMRQIQRALPEARFVHVIRDGRDVALSVLDRTVRDIDAPHVAKRWMRKIEKARETAPDLTHYGEIRYEDLITDTEPTLRKVCELIDLEFDPVMLDYHERSSDRLSEMARALPADDRYANLSVERRMATHEMTTKPPDSDRVSRWKRQMGEADRLAFEEVAGSMLDELGYETGVPVDAA